MLGHGIDLWMTGVRGGGLAGPGILLSGAAIAEGTAEDVQVGLWTGLNPPEGATSLSGTFVGGDDAGGRFKMGTPSGFEIPLLAGATATDYETATSHSITGIFQFLDGALAPVGDPIEVTRNVPVTNVIEAPVNLVAPAVTGSLSGILACSTGTWTDMAGGSFAYQWKDAFDDSVLTGETTNQLNAANYGGLEAYCTVTATNSADSMPADSNTVGPLQAIPSAFVAGNWSVAPGDTQANVTISSLPAANGAAITDVEYRLDGGSWISSGGVTSFIVAGLTNAQVYDVELRAVNSVGAGPASDVKQVTPVAAGADIILLWGDETGSILLWGDETDELLLWGDEV